MKIVDQIALLVMTILSVMIGIAIVHYLVDFLVKVVMN